MKKPSIECVVAVVVLALAAVGCASSQQTFVYEPSDIDPDYWLPRVDRFVVVVDGSGSMRDRYQGEKKLEIERDLVLSMVETIPELSYDAALRVFGRNSCTPTGRTGLLEGVDTFLTGDFETAGGKIRCTGGSSPMHAALDGASGDLSGATGDLALIVISDGLQMKGPRTRAAIERLGATYGDRLCIYSILVGRDPEGHETMERIASATGCGEVLFADGLTDSSSMAAFVKKALLNPDSDADGVPDGADRCPNTPRGVEVDAAGCPVDSDGDGVADYLDACPGTPKGTPVDARGCPLDSDGDGVTDDRDACPNTPKGVRVDERGCPIEEAWSIDGAVLFDTDRWQVKPEGRALLDKIARMLEDHPGWRIEIHGHTDSTGPGSWNQILSERRAESVKATLVELGVAAERLSTEGHGPSKPVASNDTREGRSKNRRVDFRPLKP